MVQVARLAVLGKDKGLESAPVEELFRFLLVLVLDPRFAFWFGPLVGPISDLGRVADQEKAVREFRSVTFQRY